MICLTLCCLTYDSFSQDTTAINNEGVTITVEKSNKIFIGINGGIGIGKSNNVRINELGFWTNYYNSYYSANVGIDFAFPIGNVFALGPFASVGYDKETFATSLGALAMFRFKNESAIMVGEGLNILPTYGLGNSTRLGFKFKERIYLFGEVATSLHRFHTEHVKKFTDNISFLIHVGFKLN